jgi:hypothetical protein
MNKLVILIILLLIVVLFSIKTSDNFKSINKFQPFYYGNINSQSDYTNRNYYPYNYPTFFKLGEINVNAGPYKTYDKYLNALHNRHMNERISNFNYSCPCQKLSN